MIHGLIALLYMSSIQGFDNTPPIPERRPGYAPPECGNRLQIDVEIFFDLLCDGCAMMHPEFQRFLSMPYPNSTTNTSFNTQPKGRQYQVKDLIGVNYAFFGLPYHHASWIPHRLLPYIIDQCINEGAQSCRFDRYVNYTFEVRDKFLEGTGRTYDNLTEWWISDVSQRFNWSLTDL